jgi:hypothetical protein
MKNSNNSKILLEIELIKLMNIEEEKEINNKEVDSSSIMDNKEVTLKKKEVDEISIDSKKQVKNKELEELKKIRINNSLVSVSQKKRKEFIEKLELLKPLLMTPEYSKEVSLIFDGELKAISDLNIVFVYKKSLLADAFNLELITIQKIFKENFANDFKLIAVSADEWNEIKEDYNKNKKNYIFKEELKELSEIYKSGKEIRPKEANEIEDLFDDIIEYE